MPTTDTFPAPYCSRCGAPLANVAPTGGCPQCGLPRRESLGHPSLAAPPVIDGVLAGDRSCRRCGYNLRGLSPQGACTECGAPVSESLRNDAIRYADWRWVRSIAHGSAWMLASLAFMLLSFVGYAAVAIGSTPRVAMLSASALRIAVLVNTLMICWAVWRLTERPPRRRDSERVMRLYLRAAAIVHALSMVIHRWMQERGASWDAERAFTWASFVIWIPATVVYFLFLARLARRIPDRLLERFAHGLAIAAAVCVGGLTIDWMTELLELSTGSPPWLSLLLYAQVATATGALVFHVLFVILAWREWRIVSETRRTGRPPRHYAESP